MELATYSPLDVIVLIANIIPLTGMVDGTFIKVSKDEDIFSTRTSADGVVSRSHKDSQVYTVEITLHQASESNDILSKLMIADATTRAATFPLFMKDATGSFIFQSLDSWIVGPPSITFSNEISDRTWRIACSGVSMNVGGNDGESGVLRDLSNVALGALPNLGSLF